MAGLVKVNDVTLDKPGHLILTSSRVSLKKAFPPYVSRGGLKLEAALDRFSVDVSGKVLLDVGASTGGFTDCLLQRGVEKVIAVDVGYGQLHWKIRKDPRVTVLEKTNIRYLGPEKLKEKVDGAVIDVSFISLKHVVPPVSKMLLKDAFIIALIKPQFEVERGQVGKGGVVRDPALPQQVINNLSLFFEGLGWRVTGHIQSPLLGPKGNREFFIHLEREQA
jgi:23S rRNA (cytidine1920-2'-O)/16S rRNA (cytidine1409-2'-O)-methyltransferase